VRTSLSKVGYERDRVDEDPPCGVNYLRATHAVDSFELTASLTREVHWTGFQTEGENALPSGTFETSHTIVVNESQVVVR
jgi:enoyl reductase